MASTIPNERRLRQILVATLLPAFPIIIAAGVITNRSWYGLSAPAVIFFGIIPAFLSALTSLSALKAKHDPLAKRTPGTTGLWVFTDLFLALSHLAILLPVWIIDLPSMRYNTDGVVLQTYATVFLMSNMFIHAYLALYPFKAVFAPLFKPLFESLSAAFGSQKECPHCHGKLGSHPETAVTKREGYSLLRAENYLDEQEGEASTGTIRLSTDSEA